MGNDSTGKNLGEIVGNFGRDDQRAGRRTPMRPASSREKLFIMANRNMVPREGRRRPIITSPSPGADQGELQLNHVVSSVLRSEGLHAHESREGIKKGGCIVWESSDTPETAWERSPRNIGNSSKKTISAFTSCPDLNIARQTTNKAELQLRMQGNSFLARFFRCFAPSSSTIILPRTSFTRPSKNSIRKNSAGFGDDVVTSNMTVMMEGFSRVQEIKYGQFETRISPLCAIRP